jgi:hypothetical protein
VTSHKRKVGASINYSGSPGRSDRRYNLAMADEGWADLDTLRRALPNMSIAQIITNALRAAVRDDMPNRLRVEQHFVVPSGRTPPSAQELTDIAKGSALPEKQPPQQDGRG